MKRILRTAVFLSSTLILTTLFAEGYRKEAILPIPENPEPPKTAELGRQLFGYKGISKTGLVACKSCHQPHKGFTQPVSGFVQTPSLHNLKFNDRFFWNGRAANLKAAIRESLYSKTFMGNDEKTFIFDLQQNEKFKRVFGLYYPDGVTEDNLVDALEQYIITLTTPNAPFDKFLDGEEDAISADAKEGYGLFKEYGCISCHQGTNVGGNLMQKYGVYYEPIKEPSRYDLGHFIVSQDEDDRFVFRVPSLRNIERTPPYMHNGSIQTLNDAIIHMGEVQLNQKINKSDAQKIEAFLESLTGKWEQD